MRIDSFAGRHADPAPARATTPGQASFGQTMLTLEHDMWPGAKAGAAATETIPRQTASAARSSGAADGFPEATADRLAAESTPASSGALSLAEDDIAASMRGAMPAWIVPSTSPSNGAPTMPLCPVPFRTAASIPAAEPGEIGTCTPAPSRREEAASNDRVVAAGGLSHAAVVLRFDAPLEQRKALFDAVSAELRKRGQAHRPIVINGTPYTASTRGKP